MTTMIEAAEIDAIEYEAALDRVRAYAKQIEVDAQRAQRDSIARAADLALIYEVKQWTKDSRLPKPRPDATGVVHGDTRERFVSKWLPLTGITLDPSYAKRLLYADDLLKTVVPDGTTVQNGHLTEAVLRPLKKLESKGYPEAVERVFRQVVEDTNGVPTEEQITKAVAAYLGQFSSPERTQRQRKAAAERYYEAAIRAAEHIEDQPTFRKLVERLTEMYNTRIEAARIEAAVR